MITFSEYYLQLILYILWYSLYNIHYISQYNTVLKTKKSAVANFPFLTPHPKHGELRTNARLDQTYDQIAVFSNDVRLPNPEDNSNAGTLGNDGYDYGVFNFVDINQLIKILQVLKHCHFWVDSLNLKGPIAFFFVIQFFFIH